MTSATANTPKATSTKSKVMKAASFFLKKLGNRSEALKAAWSFVKNASSEVESASRGIITLGAMHPKHVLNKVAKTFKSGLSFTTLSMFLENTLAF